MVNGNIVLIGMPGSGKSKLGKQVSKRLGLGFVDLDEFISAQERSTIERLFREKGEVYFREIEKKFMKEFLKLHSHVVVLGGGSVVDEGGVEMMNQIGESYWIDVGIDELKNRMLRNINEIERRPMFRELLGKDNFENLVVERLQDLYLARRDFYAQANFQFAVNYGSEDQVAQMFCKRFLENSAIKLQEESATINAE
ncbi:MAG: hypothetical protein KBD78_00450 [Oligoflexales bacterium]|nr:hypothetical protein [Oligoflexales bacterium]